MIDVDFEMIASTIPMVTCITIDNRYTKINRITLYAMFSTSVITNAYKTKGISNKISELSIFDVMILILLQSHNASGNIVFSSLSMYIDIENNITGNIKAVI